MSRLDKPKLALFEARHPGLLQRVDEMLAAGSHLNAVQAMLLAEYGERISIYPLWRYKNCVWGVRRRALQAPATAAPLQKCAGCS